MASLSKEDLHQRWMHSREEDTPTETVFRPADYNFPPARGRTGFELKPNGEMVEIGIAPTDAQQENKGKWKLEDGNKLSFYQGPEAEPSQTMQVASADKDKLVIKK